MRGLSNSIEELSYSIKSSLIELESSLINWRAL